MTASFFTVEHGDDGSDWFRPTEACRGPWSADACHAGPPTGLLARACERLLPNHRLARLTVDLARPVPHAGFSISSEVTRRGRTVSTAVATIVDGDDRPIATATSMHVAASEGVAPPTVPGEAHRLADARPDRFPVERSTHDLTWFSSGVEVRYPPGQTPEPGPTTIWMRALPLLPDETPSGFQRIAPLADCGNAVSRNADLDTFGFLNTDLTILLHRDPVGEWCGSDAVSRWEPTGHGMSDALLFDERGPIGRAIQTLIVSPR